MSGRAGIDGERLLRTLDELSSHGRTASGGVTRLPFSAADLDARRFVSEEMASAGLAVSTDAAGNLIGSNESTAEGPAVALGSHLDTVIDGGRLDGAFGVAAAIEVARAIGASAALRVVAFVDEEGTTLPVPMWGSRAIAGALPPLDAAPTTLEGHPVAELLARIGGDLSRLETARWVPDEVACFIEAHVEQGPVLERGGYRIGSVTAITGQACVDVIVHGRAEHAGTAPMDGRSDALVVASRLVLAAHNLATDGHVRVATVGVLHVEPGARNVVPGRVSLKVDVRDDDDRRLAAACAELRRQAELLEHDAGIAVNLSVLHLLPAQPMSAALVGDITTEAGVLGLPSTELVSGAGHDAQLMANVTDAGMIFVPSIGGTSHVPSERTADDDLVAGAEVLLRVARRVADRTRTRADRVAR